VPGVCITPGSRNNKTIKFQEEEVYWFDQLSTTVAYFEILHIPNSKFESGRDHNPAMVDFLGIIYRPICLH
jgi:hypothetical protein